MTADIHPIPTAEKPKAEEIIGPLIEDMVIHAKDLHRVLVEQGSANDIKDRITCLKYLEDVMKSYFLLKKAASSDPAAAGSAVRKYAGNFTSKDAARGGKKTRGRPAAVPSPILDEDADSDDDGTAA